MIAKLHLEKGRISRIANREAVLAGHSYISCLCHQCKEPLFLILADGMEEGSKPLTGGGKINSSCRSCNLDDSYTMDEFSVCVAIQDQPATYQQRVEPSAMPRQKLNNTKYAGKANVTFGTHAVEDRPKAGALIARVVSLSSEMDAAISYMLASMLSANTEPAMAFFLSLRQSRFQRESLLAVANVVLTAPRDLELFSAVLALRSNSDNERDALAHGRFGIANEIDTGILWVDSVDFLIHTVRLNALGGGDSENPKVKELAKWFHDRIYLYELADLERIARDVESGCLAISQFTGYLRSEGALREELYRQLSSQSPLAQAIHTLRAAKEKKTQGPPG